MMLDRTSVNWLISALDDWRKAFRAPSTDSLMAPLMLSNCDVMLSIADCRRLSMPLPALAAAAFATVVLYPAIRSPIDFAVSTDACFIASACCLAASAAAAAAVKAAWEVASGPLANMSNLISMVNYHAVDIGSTGGTITDLASSATGGLSTATLSTRAACALIKWNGSNRSRSTRGRLYFGPIREADIDPDGATVSSAIRTTFSTAFTNFRTSLSSAGYPLVVLSRKTSTATVVTQHAVETLVATQRRRIR